MSVKFQYRPRTVEDVKRQAEQSSGNFDRIFKADYDIFTPQDGENVIRFCPPTWEDAHHYAYEIWVHFNVGPRNGTYLCPKKMLNKTCPICDAADDALRHGEKDDASKLNAKKRYVAWVLNRNSDTPKIPALWSHGWTTDKDINASLTDKRRGEVLQIDHPEEGYDIIFQRTSGKEPWNTKYSGVHADRESTPMLERAKDIDFVMDYVEKNPVPDTLKFFSSEYLADLISGATGEDDDTTNEDDMKRTGTSRRDAPVRGRARDDDEELERPARGRKAAVEVDEEDDDEEQPVPARARGRGKVVEDEDADDADVKSARAREDDDEEDEVPPVRGRGRKVVEEEEEEVPVKKRAKAALPYDDDDADTSDTEIDEEEEAAPPSRSTRQARNGDTRGAKPAREEEEDRPARRLAPRDSRSSTKGGGRTSRR